MTARLAGGFVTREEAGLRRPRSVSRNITPGDGGCAVHHGGPAQRITDHARCLRTWRGWQAYHMDTHGWADLAYSAGFCDHGYALAGRGAGVRTAANGTNDGNQRFYAFVWLGGEGETPTTAALDALEWLIAEFRRVGGAGDRVLPHRTFRSTSCPGAPLVEHAARLDRQPMTTTPTAPAPAQPAAPTGELDVSRIPIVSPGRGMDRPGGDDHVRIVQALLIAHRHDLSQEGGIDGMYGPGLERELKSFQAARGLAADGIVGPRTWERLVGATPA